MSSQNKFERQQALKLRLQQISSGEVTPKNYKPSKLGSVKEWNALNLPTTRSFATLSPFQKTSAQAQKASKKQLKISIPSLKNESKQRQNEGSNLETDLPKQPES